MDFSAEHVIVLSTVDGEREVEVLHPDSCKQEPGWDGMVLQRLCGISATLAEGGVEWALGPDLADGYYLAQFWASPPGWAGSEPIDADAGIELTRMQLVDEVGQPLPTDPRGDIDA